MDKMNLFIKALPYIGAFAIIWFVADFIRGYSAGWALLSVPVMIWGGAYLYNKIKKQGQGKERKPASASQGKPMRIDGGNNRGQIEGGKR